MTKYDTCHIDFSRKEATQVSIVALLLASDGGGEIEFPSLGVRVSPRRGRLLMYETLLPDGSCDPSVSRPVSAFKVKLSVKSLVKSNECVGCVGGVGEGECWWRVGLWGELGGDGGGGERRLR